MQLVWSGIGSPETEVLKPILDYQKWASPTKDAALTSALEPIGLPYAFTINTVTGGGKQIILCNMQAAALTSVQATYKAPFVNGVPVWADLHLTFTDIEPLTTASFSNNISTSTSGVN